MMSFLRSVTLLITLTFMVSNLATAQFQMEKTADAPTTSLNTDKNDGQWIQWDDGVNEGNGIGTGGAVVFSVASRWFSEDLTEYDGMEITKISFVPLVGQASYVIKIWEGSTLEPVEVYSQNVTSVTETEWNEIELTTPYTINATEGVWFGYQVDTPGGHPAGCDAGPQVPGKGNMMFFQDSWDELANLGDGLTFNWSLAAYVEGADEPGETYTVTFEVKDEEDQDIDNAVITFNSIQNAAGDYVFENVAPGTHSYSIEKDGFSITTGEVTVDDEDVIVVAIMEEGTTSVVDPAVIQLSVFPNPANSIVSIQSAEQINEVRMIDMLGKVVYSAPVQNARYEMNVAGFNTGVYFIQVLTANGMATERLQISK